MTSRPAHPRRRLPRHHLPGTAMTEFVLIVPLLAVILGLTFFFGWALMHKHQVLVADRYSAWRNVETGSWPSNAELNTLVFKDRAQSLNLSEQQPVTETVNDLVEAVGECGPRSWELADELLHNRFPTGRRALVEAEFDANQALWDQFNGPIQHHHGREGVTWRRDEVECWQTLRDLFYPVLDESLQRVAAPGDRMAQMVRSLYLMRW